MRCLSSWKIIYLFTSQKLLGFSFLPWGAVPMSVSYIQGCREQSLKSQSQALFVFRKVAWKEEVRNSILTGFTKVNFDYHRQIILHKKLTRLGEKKLKVIWQVVENSAQRNVPLLQLDVVLASEVQNPGIVALKSKIRKWYLLSVRPVKLTICSKLNWSKVRWWF